MRGILRLEMLSLSGGGKEERRVIGDREKKDRSVTEKIISGRVSRRKLL